jgi:hypothetical protein
VHFGTGDFNADIESIEQRAGHAPAVAGAGRRTAPARARRAALAARARVHRCDEQESGRQLDAYGGAGHPHDALFERLP